MNRRWQSVRTVHGVDFSGASDAGRKIWIASGVAAGSGLRVETCRRAEALPDSDRQRDRCVDGFVRSFSARYASPQAFREACRAAAGGAELKRVTDVESRTPFSPYNLRLYRQAYFGTRDLLAPQVREGAVSVLPMQRPEPGRPRLIEVCPASTLRRLGCRGPYKGRGTTRRQAREAILARLEEESLTPLAPELRREAVRDVEGDVLDSVVAALAAFRALGDPAVLHPPPSEACAQEGYVHV